VRGKEIGAIFQDPLTTLNPLYTVGRQLAETMTTHLPIGPGEARQRAIQWLDMVGIPSAAQRIDAYPHEFSGGMRQRVVIALALCAEPRLVIALLKTIVREKGAAMMLVTHDMGVIAETADRVAVMYAGRIAEIGPVRDVVLHPSHPYTSGLMASIPPIDRRVEALAQIEGAMPRLSAIPPGCAFNPRCSKAFDRCRLDRPELRHAGRTEAACWLFEGAA
jgi:peptide/nickel transport system ATP-binding protein